MNQKKKKNTHNDISMAYRIVSLGRGKKRVSKKFFLRMLLDFIRGEISELPTGWKVNWIWRNSSKSSARSDTIQNVIGDSRDSFMTLMARRIERDLNALGFTASGNAGKKRKRKAQQFKKKHGKKHAGKMSKVRKRKPKNKRRGKRRKNS